MSQVPSVTLHDGVKIPQLGFGVFQVPPDDTEQIVEQALEIGYRHIDTAAAYRNEKGVGKTPAQAILRWHLQLGNVVIPKSVTPERIRENFDLFDLDLSEPEMDEMGALDRGERIGPDPATFALA